MTVQWVLGEVKTTPEKLARIVVDAMPGKLMKLFLEFEMLK